MYKFRTMYSGTEEEQDTGWTVAGDSRCTPIGRILRRLSLDELPQFINVLQGRMSIIGPRPERLFFVNRFSNEIPEYLRRHRVRSGITGWAQVNGLRGDTSISERIKADLYYISNWSILLDLKIFFLTLIRVLLGRNAY